MVGDRFCIVLERLEVLDDKFVEFFYNEALLFVKALDLGYLLVFFEVLGEFIEGRKKVSYHFILFVFASIS